MELKNVFAGAFHCYIRFPKLLYDSGISGHKEEKILIQFDNEEQGFNFEPEKIIINKFDVFTSINSTPIDLLLAQKFYTLVNRKRKKGRDFFDILFLLKKTQPNYAYLNKKMGIKNSQELKDRILFELESIQLEKMVADVSPFVFNPRDTKQILLFKEYINQTF